MFDGHRLDCGAGTLLGAACGDALGVPYEFGSIPLGSHEPPSMLGGGLGDYAPGEYSDDTQMTVPIASTAADGHDLRDPTAQDLIAEAWMEWMTSGATDIGTQTRAVLSSAVADPRGRPAERLRRHAQALHHQTGRTGGNGSLMRTSPVALVYLDDADAMAEAARSISSLTHPDPMAGDACVLWCAAIRAAILDGALTGPWAGLELISAARRDDWATIIRDAERRTPAEAVPNGYAPVALQAAWSAITHTSPELIGTDHLATGLGVAIHIGDDTDTIAAITGALLGARWGATAIPTGWKALVHGWPGLDSSDLADLSARIVSTSRS